MVYPLIKDREYMYYNNKNICIKISGGVNGNKKEKPAGFII
jgi:hypothetical protein